jgi:hypothetical protein
MTLDEAVELGKRAIYHATNRDTGSGGVARVYHVHENGWTEVISGEDVNVLHYEYLKQKGFEEFDKTVGKIEWWSTHQIFEVLSLKDVFFAILATNSTIILMYLVASLPDYPMNTVFIPVHKSNFDWP